MNTVPKSANSLSTLLGQYMSDSENEDDDRDRATSIATKKSIDSFLSEIASSTQNQSNLATYWTECLDKTTGHPYYWNTETKEVTWDKPVEYVDYLNNMRTAYAVLPQDSWSIGYSDDAKTPYYVNEITRVVSWEKPANFREKPIIVPESKQTLQKKVSVASPNSNTASTKLARKKMERKLIKKSIKKNMPKHLQHNSDDDEKIELISAYSEPVDSSSEEEKSTAKETMVIRPPAVKSPQINLVAAYATDSDSDGENEDSKQRRAVIGSKKNKKNEAVPETIAIESDSNAATTQPAVSPLKINTNSFASIITGGKTNDSAMDEELNKFKEELEKDMQIIDVDAPPDEFANEAVKEQSFDEKTFQRKRRIEFKTKSTDEQPQQRLGFGYADSKTETSTASKPKYISFQKSHVEFEQSKSSTEESSTHGQQPSSPSPLPLSESIDSDQQKETERNGNRAECKTEIDDLCDVITGKVKFLSVGKPDVSAVQIMSIQLETLQAAFRASCLDSDYFFKWLKTTSDDLLTLEKTASPDGWECKWDRENSQYCYKNLTTNAMQWEFPYETVQDEVKPEQNNKTIPEPPQTIRADDEMDISTTPPPPSPPIISAHSTSLIWDQDHFTTKPPELSEPSRDDTSTRPNDISGELASFYSDIATLDPLVSTVTQTPEIIESQDKSNDATKRAATDDIVSKKLKKRKKIKVPGLGSKMQEVSSMVANWQKAQKELGS